MRIDAIELRQVEIPMTEPLAAAHGVLHSRATTFVRVLTDEGEGWGECAALNEPTYSPDWANGSYLVLQEVFIPALLAAGAVTAETVMDILAPFKLNNPAKASLEMACLDAQLTARNQSLANYFGATKKTVEATVVVGLVDDDVVEKAVQEKLDMGFRSVKLKIVPGRDLRRVDIVRAAFPNLPLRLDANGSYQWNIPEHRRLLKELSERDIDLVEQPLPVERAHWYVELRKELPLRLSLDESLVSLPRAIDALELKLCDAVVVKPGMIGGYLAARKLHDECQKRNVLGAVGGMIDAPLARAANLTLAALPAFSDLPAEVAPDGRWFSDRLGMYPVELSNGELPVPYGPGIGATLDPKALQAITVRTHTARRSALA